MLSLKDPVPSAATVSVLPGLTKALCHDGIAAACQCMQVSICQYPSPALRPPSTLLMDTCCINIASLYYRWKTLFTVFLVSVWEHFSTPGKCQLLQIQAKLGDWNNFLFTKLLSSNVMITQIFFHNGYVKYFTWFLKFFNSMLSSLWKN